MKIVNAMAMVLSIASVSGCSLLPTSDRVPSQFGARDAADQGGVQVRLSKRGNMDSYVVRGTRYHTLKSAHGYSARGVASWYGPNFHGRSTSNGEVYDMYRLTAAHRALPLPTYARVTHLGNGKSVIVKINDRGPFSGDRLLDLSFAAALKLGMVNEGTAMVDIQALSASELMAMTGPENSMDIDFYDPMAEQQSTGEDGELVTVAAVYHDQNTVPEVPVEGVADKLTEIANAKGVVANAQTDATLPELGNIVESPASVTDGLLVEPTAIENTITKNDEYQAGQSIDLTSLNSVEPVAAAAVGETVYYVQAGVFPNEDYAERAAVDIVLEVPNEAVTIKPLKNSEMFRVTIGPVLESDHASEISKTLHDAGLDNFTVKVKE